MFNIATRLARAQKELAAIKAGFHSGQDQFFGSTITTQVFNISTNKPLVIDVDFEYLDFPQLYVVTYSHEFDEQYWGDVWKRKSFYQWRTTVPQTYVTALTFTCTLISEKPPTRFTIMEEI